MKVEFARYVSALAAARRSKRRRYGIEQPNARASRCRRMFAEVVVAAVEPLRRRMAVDDLAPASSGCRAPSRSSCRRRRRRPRATWRTRAAAAAARVGDVGAAARRGRATAGGRRSRGTPERSSPARRATCRQERRERRGRARARRAPRRRAASGSRARSRLVLPRIDGSRPHASQPRLDPMRVLRRRWLPAMNHPLPTDAGCGSSSSITSRASRAARSRSFACCRRLTTEIDVHVVLGEDGPLVERLRAQGISVEVLPLAPATARSPQGHASSHGSFDPMAAARVAPYVVRLARRIRAHRADLVHTNSLKAALYGGAAGRLARVPVIWHLRDRIADDYLPHSAVVLVRAAARDPSDSRRRELASHARDPSERSVGSRRLQPDRSRRRGARARRRSGDAGTVTIGRDRRSPRPLEGTARVPRRLRARRFAARSVRGRVIGSAMFGEDAYAQRPRAAGGASRDRATSRVPRLPRGRPGRARRARHPRPLLGHSRAVRAGRARGDGGRDSR